MKKDRIWVKPSADLESQLGYKFKKSELLKQALTHETAIREHHPMAAHCDLAPLAFVGDVVLKYAIARYLLLHGRSDVIVNAAQLHLITEAVIQNQILAQIAQEKLPLADYLVRGNGCSSLTNHMYAECLQAIFGAIALDCDDDQQQPIFSFIEQICSHRVEKWLGNETIPQLKVHQQTNEADIDCPNTDPQPTAWDRRSTFRLGNRSWREIWLTVLLVFISFYWLWSIIKQYYYL